MFESVRAVLEGVSSFFVSEALAMAPPQDGGGGPGGAFAGFLPLIIIFVIFYFLLIRPQQKKTKDQREMLASLKRGDKVITSGGIYGLIEQVGAKTVTLKIAENLKVKFGKAYIASVRSTSDEE
jgi:preprotein translocase subunit YajC